MIEVKWICPVCLIENTDLYDETTFPVCEQCEDAWEWDMVLNEEEMQRYNKLWVEQELKVK